MFKKLCIFLIFSKLKVTKLLIDQYRMHNLYAIFAKLLNICKQIAGIKSMNLEMYQDEELFLKFETLK